MDKLKSDFAKFGCRNFDDANVFAWTPYVSGNFKCFVTHAYPTSSGMEIDVSNLDTSAATITVGCVLNYRKVH